jgi:hypothetical protein
MSSDTFSLIEECTNATTKAGLYLSRLGMEQGFKNPNKPGRPNFESEPVLEEFWGTARQEANAIATRYKSRKAIREALRLRNICLDEIARDCLERYGRQIWNNGREKPFVLSLDLTTTPSKIKGHAQVLGDIYTRHLIYEHPSDERKYVNSNECPSKRVKANIVEHRIRLQVSAYIVQRACRKAEDDRRKGKTTPKASKRASSKFSSFMEAVRVKPGKRTRSTSLSSTNSMDELCMEYPANSSTTSKRTRHSDSAGRTSRRPLRKDHVVRQTPEKRYKTTVSVVIPARKPQDIKATGITSERREGSEPQGKNNTVRRSASGQIKDKPRETAPPPNPCRQMPPRTRKRTDKCSADMNLKSLVRQLQRDRDGLDMELSDLLSPHNPGCHSLTDIKRTTGLIDTIALNDTEGLQKALGDTHDKCKVALDRWLGCVKTLVEFREITGLKGDEDEIKASFRGLPLQTRKKARAFRSRKRQEILSWVENDGFDIAGFCKEVASVLLQMTRRGDLDMDEEELLDDLIPFTSRLLEWFSAVPAKSATSVGDD